MARMLFIVQGEGRGHLSQSVALKEYLEEAGHHIMSVFVGCKSSGQIPAYYQHAFLDKLKPFSSPGFLRTPNRKGIYVGRTILYNLTRIPAYLRELRRIRRDISRLNPDVVFNFYEIVGALAMRKLAPGIRRVGIGHHFLLHLEGYRCGGNIFWQKALLKLHTSLIMKSCDLVLALSYKERDGLGKIKVLPPLVRKQFREAKHKKGRNYLVYLLNEGFVVDLMQLVRGNTALRFDVFSDLPLETPMPEGIKLHPIGDAAFYEKMKQCRGVICTAGFDTAAEAACMGIPLGVIPVENHFEQLCNSADVERSGIGIAMENLNGENLAGMRKIDHIAYRKWVESAGSLILMQLRG